MTSMGGQRFELGTDQLALPLGLSPGTPMSPLLPPSPRRVLPAAPHAMLNKREAAELAPWADHLMLPGVGS